MREGKVAPPKPILDSYKLEGTFLIPSHVLGKESKEKLKINKSVN